jgi:hypothetical protein
LVFIDFILIIEDGCFPKFDFQHSNTQFCQILFHQAYTTRAHHIADINSLARIAVLLFHVNDRKNI